MYACSLCHRSTHTFPCYSLYVLADYMTADIIVNGYAEETMMNTKFISTLFIGLFLLTGCDFSISTLPTLTPPATATMNFITTETPSPIPPLPVTDIPVFTATATSIPPVATNVCADPQVIALIDSLKNAMLTSDGALLSSVVSPNDMEVRWVRYGNIVTYDQEQTKFLFETTFAANWGAEPGSGQDKQGSFHDVIVPEFVKVFNHPYTLHCNEIKHGGATYEVSWPYDKDFYAIYDAGTNQNGFLDWTTWAVGIEYVNDKPFIYALMQFFWEP